MPTPRPDETEDEFVSRCVPMVIEEGTAEDGAQASAICHSMFREAKKMINGRGLYLTELHGRMIWEGKKSFIAKAKEFDLEGDWHIISKNKAYGKATMGDAQSVESSEFDELFDVHRITHKERRKWWGEKAPLYLYEIKSFEKYDPPLKVDVPDGGQFVIDTVEFVDPFPEGVKASLAQNDEVETEAIPSGNEVVQSSTDEEVEVEDEKAGRRIRTSKVSVLKDLKKKIEDFMKDLGDLIGFAEYADKQPFYDLFNKKESGFKTFKKDDKTWILTWTTNSFIDREEEIFSQKSIEDYVERHFEDDVKGEFQFWHMPGSKFGDILWQGVSGRFLVEAGPFDDTPIGQAFEKAFTENPDGHPIVAPEGWGTSHKYYFKLEDREDGVYNWFDKEETTVLPMSAASNPHSPKLEVLKMEQKQVDALNALLGDEELSKAIVEAGDEETKTLEDAGVARKEKESDEKEIVAEAEAEGEIEVGDETVEIEVEIEAESLAEEVEGEKEEVDEPEFVTLEEVKAGFGALASAIKELMGKVDSIETSVKSLERTDDEKFDEKVELTPKASLKDHVESVIGKDETKIDGREKLAKDGPEETEVEEKSLTGVPLLDNIKKRNIDHDGTKIENL